MPEIPVVPTEVVAAVAKQAFAAGWLARVVQATQADIDPPDTPEPLREIARLRALLRTAFSHAPIGMAVTDRAGDVLIANDALCAIAGRAEDELLGHSFGDFVEPVDRLEHAGTLERLLAGQTDRYSAEVRVRRPDGEIVWVRATVAGDGEAEPSLIYQVENITEPRHMRLQLEYLVDHDQLTGLFNRRRFDQELARELARDARSNAGGALLMIDLDGFKAINDEFGHAAGDQLLRGISSTLAARVRATDTLARLSGDEFGLIIPDADRHTAEQVAETLLGLIGRHAVPVAGAHARVTASVGVAMFAGIDAVALHAAADTAMYAVKQSGRNRVHVADPANPGPNTSPRLAEARQLRRALRHDGFVLHAQPICSLADGTVHTHELLIRMRDPNTGTLIAPNAFLYAAERFGMITAIDTWVVEQAIGLIAAHATRGRRVNLTVNLSGRSIGDPALALRIDELLDQSGIDPTCLTFELTETAAIADVGAARRFASHLQDHGCKLALDDFGAGFASFYYLKTLPFDIIKIDGTFIQTMLDSRTDQLVVAAIVDVARGMGKQTIAEFVGNEDTRTMLAAHGVDYAQGFHIAIPAPIDELLPT